MNDLNALQQLTDHTTSNVANQLLGWLVVPSLILTLIILALYIAALVRRRRMESAVFEIRDLLKDMKAGGQPLASTPEPTPAPEPPSTGAPTPNEPVEPALPK